LLLIQLACPQSLKTRSKLSRLGITCLPHFEHGNVRPACMANTSLSSKSNLVEPFTRSSIRPSRYSFMVQPKLLHLSLRFSCNSFGIRAETVLDICLQLYTTVYKLKNTAHDQIHDLTRKHNVCVCLQLGSSRTICRLAS